MFRSTILTKPLYTLTPESKVVQDSSFHPQTFIYPCPIETEVTVAPDTRNESHITRQVTYLNESVVSPLLHSGAKEEKVCRLVQGFEFRKTINFVLVEVNVFVFVKPDDNDSHNVFHVVQVIFCVLQLFVQELHP